MNFPDDFFAKKEPHIQKAFSAMVELERGAIANPAENRRVGHYWLRHPELVPTPEIKREIDQVIARIHSFVDKVYGGRVVGENGLLRI